MKRRILWKVHTGFIVLKFRDGRPPIDQKRKDFAVDLILNQHKTYREVVELTGLSKSTLIRAVNAHRGKIALEKKIVD